MTTDVTTQEVTTQSTAAAGGAVELGAVSSSREVWRRFTENKLALFGLLLIGILLVTAAFAPLIAPYDLPGPGQHPGTAVERALAGHRSAGTRPAVTPHLRVADRRRRRTRLDPVGNDHRRRAGALAGWYGGGVDSVVMRVADVFFAFPLLIGAIVIILVLGRGVTPVVLSLAIFSWATVARLQRSSILTVRESDYVMPLGRWAPAAGGW